MTGIVAYATWVKAVLDSPDLLAFNEPQRKAEKFHYDIRLTALMIAKHGSNGRGCFASSEHIAPQIGCGKGVVERHRKALIEQGWFTVLSRSGGDTKRAMVLDIALPGDAKDKSQPGPRARTRDPAAGNVPAPEAPTVPVTAPGREAVTYNGAIVFGASGADPWDDDGDKLSEGPPVKTLGGKRRLWGSADG